RIPNLVYLILLKEFSINFESQHVSHISRLPILYIPISRDLGGVLHVQHRIEVRLLHQTWWKCPESAGSKDIEFALPHRPKKRRRTPHTFPPIAALVSNFSNTSCARCT